MLLHFNSSTECDKSSPDCLINTEVKKLEAIIPYKIKGIYFVKYNFTNNNVHETHKEEATARKSLKEKLTLLGFEDAEKLSFNVKFVEE